MSKSGKSAPDNIQCSHSCLCVVAARVNHLYVLACRRVNAEYGARIYCVLRHSCFACQILFSDLWRCLTGPAISIINLECYHLNNFSNITTLVVRWVRRSRGSGSLADHPREPHIISNRTVSNCAVSNRTTSNNAVFNFVVFNNVVFNGTLSKRTVSNTSNRICPITWCLIVIKRLNLCKTVAFGI